MSRTIQLNVSRAGGAVVGGFSVEYFYFGVDRPAAANVGVKPIGTPSLTVRVDDQSGLARLLELMASGTPLSMTLLETEDLKTETREASRFDFGGAAITSIRRVGSDYEVTFSVQQYDARLFNGGGPAQTSDYTTVAGFDFKTGVATDKVTGSASTTAGTAADLTYYIKLDRVPGTETVAGQAGYLRLQEFSLDIQAGGRITHEAMEVALPQSALVGLLTAETTRADLAGARIVGVDSAGQVRYDLRLGEVKVSAVSDAAGAGVTATLQYDQIGLSTYTVDIAGAVGKTPDSSFGYDFGKNVPVSVTTIYNPGNAAASQAAIEPGEFVLSYQIAGEAARHVAVKDFQLSQDSDIGIDGSLGPARVSPLSVQLASTAPADLLAAMAAGRAVTVTIHGIASVGGSKIEVYTLDLGATKVTDVGGSLVGFAAARYEIDTYSATPKGTIAALDHLLYDTTVKGPTTLASVPFAPKSDTVIAGETQYYLLLDGIPGTEDEAGRAGYFELHDLGFAAAADGMGGLSVSDVSFKTERTAFAALFDRSVGDTLVAGARIIGISGGVMTYDLRLSKLDITGVSTGSSYGIDVSADFEAAALATFAANTGAATGFFSYGAAAGTTSLDAVYSPGTSAPRSAIFGEGAAILNIAKKDGTSIGSIELTSYSFGLIGADGNSKAEFSSLSVSSSVLITPTIMPLLVKGDELVLTLQSTNANGVGARLASREFDFGGARLVDITEDNMSLTFDFTKIDVRTISYHDDGTNYTPDYVENTGYDVTTGKVGTSIDGIAKASPIPNTSVDSTSYFLLIEGVKGDATAKGFKDWFELVDFSGLSLAKPFAGIGGISVANVGVALSHPLAIAEIANLAATGKTIGSVRVVGTRTSNTGGKEIVADWRLDNVTFESITYAVGEGKYASVSMSVDRLGVQYIDRDLERPVSFGYGNAQSELTGFDSIQRVATVITLEDKYELAADKLAEVEKKKGVLSNDLSTLIEQSVAQALEGTKHGRLTLNPDGSFSYQPDAGFVGEDSFTYGIKGVNGITPRTVKLLVKEADGATAVADTAQTNEKASTSIVVLANDVGTTRTVTTIDGKAIAAGGTVTLASGAKVTLRPDGVLTYDPNHAFDWLVSADTAKANAAYAAVAVDSFTYALQNGATATVAVTVGGIDSPGTDQLRPKAAGEAVTGSTSADVINLAQPGAHRAAAGDGADAVFLGKYMTMSDVIDGGPGSDQLALQGSYTATLSGANFTGFESLALLGGSVTRLGAPGTELLTYNLTLADSFATGGGIFTINANEMIAGETLTINAAAERDTSIWVFAGGAKATLTGGGRSDAFYFGEGRFTAESVVAGGANDASGPGDQLAIRGDYRGTLNFTATTMTGIEMLVLLSASDNRFGAAGTVYGYAIKLHDANIAAGSQLYVSANTLMTTETVTLDASGETDGRLYFVGGKGVDSVKGGAVADTLYGGLGADVFTGGAGADVFLYRAVAESTPIARDRILDFATGDRIDLSAIDLDASRDGRQGFTFVAGAFTGVAGQLHAVQTGGLWYVEGDVNGDRIADFSIAVTVADGHPITAADFVL